MAAGLPSPTGPHFLHDTYCLRKQMDWRVARVSGSRWTAYPARANPCWWSDFRFSSRRLTDSAVERRASSAHVLHRNGERGGGKGHFVFVYWRISQRLSGTPAECCPTGGVSSQLAA